LADTPLPEEDDQDHPAEGPQVEDHHQEDLEVQEAIHPEHQDLLYQHPLLKEVNSLSHEQLMSSL